MLAGLPLLACLVVAVPHAQALRQARGFLAGVQLSPGEQERFGEWNRTLVLRDVGIPGPATVRSTEDRPVADPEEPDVVIALATTFVLDVPAGHDTVLEALIERFEEDGFRRHGEPGPVTLNRRGVTVSLVTGERSASVEVHRDW
jgi:hypothetical protein